MAKYHLKLFFILWVVTIAVILGTYFVGYHIVNNRVTVLKEQQLLNLAIDNVSRIYQQQGARGVNKWLFKIRSQHKLDLYVITDHSNQRTVIPLPTPVREVRRRIRSGDYPKTAFSVNNMYISQEFPITPELNGRIILHVLKNPVQGYLYSIQQNYGKLLLLMLLSGLLIYIILRILTAPIKELQQLSCAYKDYSKMIHFSDNLTKRRDELGQLSRKLQEIFSRLDKTSQFQQKLMQDVSHELRSPLARLQVALEIARRRTKGEADIEFDRIALESERLDELIGEILSLAKLQAKTKINTSKFDLVLLLNDIVKDTNYEFKQLGTKVTFEEKTACYVIGDETLIRRAIENILRNALRYTSLQKGVTMDIVKDPHSYIIHIRDYGPGVPQDALPLLFKPFYRVDSARSDSFDGYGLGLAIAQHAIHLHRGTLKAVNMKEGGLQVSISIPRAI